MCISENGHHIVQGISDGTHESMRGECVCDLTLISYSNLMYS